MPARSRLFLAFAFTAVLLGQRTDPFLQGNPFTFKELLEAVGPLPHRRMLLAIESRKVNFIVTPAQSEALQKAGVSKDILDAIRKNFRAPEAPTPAPVATAPPRVVKRNATLTAECQPAECSVFIDGQPLGLTANGRLSITEVVPRTLVVSFRKQGYVTQEFTDTLEPGGHTIRAAKLLPDEKFLAEQGQRILKSMVEALGGEPGITAASSLIATGDVTLYARDGQATQWTAAIRYLAPDAVSFRLKGAGTELQSSISAKEYRANKALAKSPLASEIDTNIRLYREYQIPSLLEKFQREKFQILALQNRLGFIARSPAETYTVSLSLALLPESVETTTSTGLGSGLQVVYANYQKDNGANLPRTLAIKLPDAPQHGMRVRLSSASPSAKLSPKNFR